MKTIKNLMIAALAVLALASCSNERKVCGPVVLLGEVDNDSAKVVILTYQVGERTNYITPEVVNGKFEFKIDSVENFVDLGVAADEDVHGARINALDTLRMKFTKEAEGKYSVEYVGNTEKESRIFTDFYNTYCYYGQYGLGKYDPNADFAGNLALLNRNDSLFRASHKGELDEHFTHFADLMGNFIKTVLIETRSYAQDVEPTEDPEYNTIIESIDPNDPYAITAPMISRWISWKFSKEFNEDEDNVKIESVQAFIDDCDKNITYAKTRKLVAGDMAEMVFNSLKEANDEQYYAFMERLKAFVPEDSKLVEKYTGMYEAFKATTKGNPLPDTELSTIDGSTTQLSSLFGKVLYIDVWATWCGPCRSEIPYLAKLVEHYKGNDNIMILSVSVDRDKEDWVKMISEEKPAWAQYWLDETSHKEFGEKMNIRYIPRFIIVDKDGKIYDGDAARPSDEKIIEILDKTIAGE